MNQHKAMTQDEVDEFMATAWPLLQQVWAKVTWEWPIPNLDEVTDVRDVTEDMRKYVERRQESIGVLALKRGLSGISVMADAVTGLAEWEAEHGDTDIPGITAFIRKSGERAIAALTERAER